MLFSVIVPIYKNNEQLAVIDSKVNVLIDELKALGISVKYDNADNRRPGFKFADLKTLARTPSDNGSRRHRQHGGNTGTSRTRTSSMHP